MEMYKDETESPEPVVKCPKKLTALDKFLDEETTVAEPSFGLESDKYLFHPDVIILLYGGSWMPVVLNLCPMWLDYYFVC